MGLKLNTAASGPPLTAVQLRPHCSIASDDASFDSLLTDYIAAATGMVQDFTGQAIGAQSWNLTLDGFPPAIELQRGPVTGVSSIVYFDSNGGTQTLAGSAYLVDLTSTPERIYPAPGISWPGTQIRANAVVVTFATGYAAAPAPILQAIRLTVANWFANREAAEIAAGALALLRPYRDVLI